MINGGRAADHLFIADNGRSCQQQPDDMNLRPHESFITLSLFHYYLAAVSTNHDDQLVPRTNHPTPWARSPAANCLIFSDVEELRDGFSQRLIIPMNSVTIPI